MEYKPGDNYTGAFTVANPATGVGCNADVLPSVIGTRNGTDDAGFSLAVANVAVGRYKITGTVPANYAKNDIVQVAISATVNNISAVSIVDNFRVDSKVPGDIINPSIKL